MKFVPGYVEALERVANAAFRLCEEADEDVGEVNKQDLKRLNKALDQLEKRQTMVLSQSSKIIGSPK